MPRAFLLGPFDVARQLPCARLRIAAEPEPVRPGLRVPPDAVVLDDGQVEPIAVEDAALIVDASWPRRAR